MIRKFFYSLIVSVFLIHSLAFGEMCSWSDMDPRPVFILHVANKSGKNWVIDLNNSVSSWGNQKNRLDVIPPSSEFTSAICAYSKPLIYFDRKHGEYKYTYCLEESNYSKCFTVGVKMICDKCDDKDIKHEPIPLTTVPSKLSNYINARFGGAGNKSNVIWVEINPLPDESIIKKTVIIKISGVPANTVQEVQQVIATELPSVMNETYPLLVRDYKSEFNKVNHTLTYTFSLEGRQ